MHIQHFVSLIFQKLFILLVSFFYEKVQKSCCFRFATNYCSPKMAPEIRVKIPRTSYCSKQTFSFTYKQWNYGTISFLIMSRLCDKIYWDLFCVICTFFLRRKICVLWPLACSLDNCLLHFYLSGDYFGCPGQADFKCLFWTLHDIRNKPTGILFRLECYPDSTYHVVPKSTPLTFPNIYLTTFSKIVPRQ